MSRIIAVRRGSGHMWILVSLIIACIGAIGPWPIKAQAQALTELTSEPSRADLFQLIVSSSQREQAVQQSGEMIPFALYGPFTFPTDATYDKVDGRTRANSIFGIDISHYTLSSIPLEKLALLQSRFAYAKATQGTGFKDGKFSEFWSRMGQLTGTARLHRGAYHFLSAAGSAVDQAKIFISFLNENGGLKITDMPPVLDLEWDIAGRGAPDRWSEVNDPDKIIEKTLAWLEYVEKATHRSPMVYTAEDWFRTKVLTF